MGREIAVPLTVGCDPEFFLRKGRSYVSAHDIVPGNKRHPHPLSVGAIQADGTAVEFNIHPAISPEQFADSIATTLAEIRAMLDPKLVFEFKPSIVYPREYFDTLPNYSKDLGCDPDYNAYTMDQNPRPQPKGALETMRTGAGHIHIGWRDGGDPLDKSHFWDCCHLTKMLDQYFRYLAPVWDTDKKRRQLYGAEGAFRPKPYGMEYRVLSNAWLKYPKLWPWLFKSVVHVFEKTQQGNKYLGALPMPKDWNPEEKKVNPPSKNATFDYNNINNISYDNLLGLNNGTRVIYR